jgi:hypothetical protein
MLLSCCGFISCQHLCTQQQLRHLHAQLPLFMDHVYDMVHVCTLMSASMTGDPSPAPNSTTRGPGMLEPLEGTARGARAPPSTRWRHWE